MLAPPLPPDEVQRLAALRNLNILDTPFEERFDRITRTARHLFQTPFALISLVDANRQWFKSSQGIAATEMPRDISFCGHAILGEEVFLVSDALDDPRFADNPLVAGEPHIRFYAGQPLHAPDGSRIGTLCVIDCQPRTLTPDDMQALRDLGAWAEQELGMGELRRAADTVQGSEARLHAIVDNMMDGLITINAQGVIESINPSAENIFGYRADEVVGRNVSMLMPEPHRGQHDGYLQRYLESGRARVIGIGRQVEGLHKDGRVFPMDLEISEMWLDGRHLFTGIVRDITDRVQAQKRMQAQEKLLNEMIDNLTVPSFIIDARHRVLRWNKACEELTGVKARDLIGTDQHWRGFYDHPRPCLADLIVDRARAKGLDYYDCFSASKFLPQGVHAEGWYPNLGGKHRYIIFDAAPLFDDAGQLVGAIESLQDITEQKLAEQALAQTSLLQRTILDSANYSIISTDTHGVIQTFNAAAERMLGYRAEEVVGMLTPAVIHDPDEIARRAEVLTQALGKKIEPGFDAFVAKARLLNVPDENEWTYIRKDGTRFPVLLSVTAIRNETGRISGYLGVAADISERIATQQSLNRFKNTLDNTLDMIFMFEPDTLRFTYLSRGAVESMGYSREELLRMAPYDIKPLMNEAEFRDMIAPLLCGEKTALNFETLHRRKDGSEFPVEVFLQLVREGGEKGLFVAIVRDITERKHVDRMKNEFVSTVSHELRTPLTSIRGSLGLILGGVAGELGTQARHLLDIAYKNSERLVRLINDILDIEKIESGKMQFDMRPQPLIPLIEQALEANRAYAEHYGVRLALQDHAASARVNVDHDRLVQVMSNLLSNAVKFSPPDGCVEVSVHRQDGRVRVEVADHGPGIPEDFRDKVFQKFSQADASDSRQKGGTGLGLSITKSIIEKMGGTIDFASLPGAGTVFHFELPEWREQGEAARPAAAPLERPRVLICEDDADVAHLIGLILAQGGFASECAGSVAEARLLLRQHDFAAMTLDLGLPDENGIAFIRELRGQPRTSRLPIVVVSGRAEEKRVAIDGGLPVIDWLDKPIDNQALVKALQNAVHNIGGHKPRVLHVEDDADVHRIVASLAGDIADFEFAETLQEATEKIALERFSLVILDLSLPDGSGWHLLPMLKKLNPPPQIMVFSGQDVSCEHAREVAAALVKSQTTNQALFDTISSLIHHGIHQQGEI